MKVANTTRPRAPESETEIAVLWSDTDTQCVLSWLGGRYRVRVTRGTSVVLDDVTADEQAALEVARTWKTQGEARPAAGGNRRGQPTD